jgi:uncharacterized protein YbjT (DUF2867 family)
MGGPPAVSSLVFGATGRVGRLVAAALARAGVRPRCFARDAERARTTLGPGVEIAAGDLDDPASLERALAGIRRVFLMNALGPELARRDAAIIDAAKRAGVARIVKLSGSSWTMRAGAETASGAQHAQSERALAASGLAHAIVRPNAFMQVALGGVAAMLAAGDTLTLTLGEARVAYIDVRDIADVAAHALLADGAANGVHEITGPAALGGAELAAIARELTGRPIAYRPGDPAQALAKLRAQGLSEFELRHRAEMMALLAAGAAERVTDTVPRLLGRTARDARSFLAEVVM